MKVESRVLFQPLFNLWVFVGGVVVQNQMKFAVCRCLRINALEKLQLLLMTMPALALSNDGSIRNIEGRKQCCGAMPQIVVRHGARAPLFER